MTDVRAFVGFKLEDLNSGLGSDPSFYSHDGQRADATVDIDGLPVQGILSLFGSFTFGTGDEPQSGAVKGVAIGAFDPFSGNYIPFAEVANIPKGIDVGALLDAVRSDTIVDDLQILAKIFGKADTFEGSDKADFFYGYKGADLLDGGKGNDTLDGGLGADTLDCGPKGVDTVVISTFDGTFDTILHFAGKDELQLSGAVFDVLKETDGHLDDSMFHAGTNAASKHDFLIYDQASGSLWYDEDGRGRAFDKVLIAEFTDGTKLDAAHIDLI